MRRAYLKPYFIVESFQLNAAVATSCSDNPEKAVINRTVNDCSGLEEGHTYFGYAGLCAVGIYEENDGEQICYNAQENIASQFLQS